MKFLVGLDRFADEIGANISGISESKKDQYRQDIEAASSSFEKAIEREIRPEKNRTRYLNGDSSSKLILPHYPVISDETDIDIRVDADRAFGASTQVSSSDLFVNRRAGIVEYVGGTFTAGTRNIRAIYDSGFSVFTIEDESNNYIDIDEGSGDVAVEISAGTYAGDELSTEIQSKLNGNGSLSNTYTVTYSFQTLKFTISTGSNFTISWSDGSSASKSIGYTIGFDVSANDSGSSSYAADYSRSGVPSEIEKAISRLAGFFYLDQKSGGARLGIKKKEEQGEVTTEFEEKFWPPFVQQMIKHYRYDKYRRNAEA